MTLDLITAPFNTIYSVADALNQCAHQSYRFKVSVLHSGLKATPSPSQVQLNKYLSCEWTPDLAALAQSSSLYDIECGRCFRLARLCVIQHDGVGTSFWMGEPPPLLPLKSR